MDPLVTVLMPVYNGEKYLAEAIQSILEQDFHDFELLLIDDGSTDQSIQVARTFLDTRIRLLRNKRNKGLVDTLNRGIRLARGRYIARMDADDVSLPHRLGLQVDHLTKRADVTMCGGAVNVMGSGETWVQPQEPEEIKCSLLFRCCIAHPTVMIRRETLTRAGLLYDPDYRHAEDYDLWVRLSRTCLLSNLRAPLIRYRLHNAQISRVHSQNQLNQVHRIHRRQLKELGLNPTELELDVHFNPSKYCGTDEQRHWFKMLRDANLVNGVYQQSIFEDVLKQFCSHE